MSENITIEELKKPGTILSMVLNCMFDGVYISDRDRRILFWNEGAHQITGYAAEEVLGRRCMDNILNHIDENGNLLCLTRCPLARAMETGENQAAKIYPLHKSGHRFPVLTHIAPIRDGEGNIIAGIEVFRDISREEEYRSLQERFNMIVRKYVSTITYAEMYAQVASGATTAVRKRDLTILYMDIVGFTPIAEQSEPESVVEMLNSFFGMCDVITREALGDIDKFMGDAIMAIFVDANDAVQAGRKILLGALPEFNRLRAEQGFAPIRIRAGINSGPLLQGEIGTTDRKDMTVIGDVVNTCNRIERLCEPDSIYISDATYSRLNEENSARFAFKQETTVKGKDQPIRVFALVDRG